MTEGAAKMEEDPAPPKKDDTKKPTELDEAQIRAKIENAKSLAKQVQHIFFRSETCDRAAVAV